MKFVDIKVLGEGSHSSEVIVCVNRSDGGTEELVVDKRSLENDKLEVGFIAKDNARTLVELPRESSRGAWRIWVPSDRVSA